MVTLVTRGSSTSTWQLVGSATESALDLYAAFDPQLLRLLRVTVRLAGNTHQLRRSTSTCRALSDLDPRHSPICSLTLTSKSYLKHPRDRRRYYQRSVEEPVWSELSNRNELSGDHDSRVDSTSIWSSGARPRTNAKKTTKESTTEKTMQRTMTTRMMMMQMKTMSDKAHGMVRCSVDAALGDSAAVSTSRSANCSSSITCR